MIGMLLEQSARHLAGEIHRLAARCSYDFVVRHFSLQGATPASVNEVLDYAARHGWIVRDGDFIEPGNPVEVAVEAPLTRQERRLRWGPTIGADW